MATPPPDHRYQLVAALFLRLLGIIYLIAFVSIGVQIEGLAGSQGILPFRQELDYIASQTGWTRYLQVPTLFWINAGDTALVGAALAGALASVLIVFDRLTRPALFAAFLLYLSLYHAGQVFLTFQWDGLLLEAGFLAIFLTPRSRIVVLLFRWLLFRLRFMSGISKLVFQDPTWSGLTALNYYFQVQPLPTPLAWYANQLPEWLLKAGTAGTLIVEILIPFMMFLTRRWRFAAAWITILWQVLIILTSNHNWFNFLTIALCLFLFDDAALQRVLPTRLQRALLARGGDPGGGRRMSHVATSILAGFVLVTSGVQLWELTTLKRSAGVIRTLVDYTEAFRVVNKYHVFAVMKTERIEVELQGSVDGNTWKTYVFKYRPGDPAERPPVVMPHHPRLDWRMWFVTMHPKHLRWFEHFLQALLDNSPPVTALLRHNPFAGQPPRFIRVSAWRYRFTTPQEGEQTGAWWHRESLGPFMPLSGVQRLAEPGSQSAPPRP
ncbi:MAG: lipase maturation factor family protein [Gammaproteobacteria bacterium]|jgi:hypothetical protein